MQANWKHTLTLGAALLALGGSAAIAQNGYHDQDRDRGNQYQGQYDNQHWGNGPEGYSDSFHEQQGHPMLGARQGWAAGFAQGQSDREHHHSFRPTHVDTYKHVPDSPDGYSRDRFKNEYRQAFVKGYAHGYGQ